MKAILPAILLFFFFSARSQSGVVKDIKSFGASGDGKTNDHEAFRRAAAFFNEHGGNGKLVIPKGIYIVGKQTFTGGQKNMPAYDGENVLSFNSIKNFTIEGVEGATLKYIDSLRIGTFSPTTGEIYDHGNNVFTKRSYAAIPGFCIYVKNSENIKISNLDLDGNNQHMILGGVFGDKGRQLQHDGIFIQNSKNIVIDKVNAHHFGLDGICVSNIKSDSPDKIEITNSNFEYNARQGLSWVGGNDLHAKNCKFNHTGKAGFSSAPSAGLDIEAEAGPIRNGVFDSCEFVDNTGLGMGADSGDSGDCTFNNCTFWGTTSWSLWVTKPNFTFNGCNIYGSTAHGYNSPDRQDATKFWDCHFEDKPYNGRPPYGRFLVESNNAKYMSFDNCTFVSNTKKLCWFQSPKTYTLEERYQLNNCKFIINNTNLPTRDFIGITRGVVAKNCTFNFTNLDGKTKRYTFGDTNPATNPGSSETKILYQGK